MFKSLFQSFDKTSETRKGEIFLLSEAFLWAFFPIITILSLNTLSPVFSLAINTLLSTVFFFIVIIIQWKFNELKNYKAYKYILLNVLIIWVWFYWLFFWWLSETSAWNWWIIALMEIFFSFLFLDLILKHQKSPKIQIFWAILMSFWALLVLLKWSFSINKWDFIILIATILPPFWNYFMQKVRKEMSSAAIMFLRSLVCSVLFFMISYFFNLMTNIDEVMKVLPWLFINWFLLLWLSKIFWIEATHRISIQKAISLNTVSPFLTLIFAYFILWEMPTWWQVLWFIPIAFWAVLIMKK